MNAPDRQKREPGFWDNLIAPKGGLFSAQLAGWTPGPAAKSGLGCRILADQMGEDLPCGRDLLPIIYTPAVGAGCQQFSRLPHPRSEALRFFHL